MKEILDFATEANPDHCYALIRDYHNSGKLKEIADKYEEGDIGDSGFCDEIIKYIEHLEPKKYVVIMCIKEEWDEPNIDFVEAMTEEEARSKYIEDGGDYLSDIDEGEEDGTF